jgi:hypothetical protein
MTNGKKCKELTRNNVTFCQIAQFPNFVFFLSKTACDVVGGFNKVSCSFRVKEKVNAACLFYTLELTYMPTRCQNLYSCGKLKVPKTNIVKNVPGFV